MAVAVDRFILSPSVDKKTKDELDSTVLESGLYYCTDPVSIKSVSEISPTTLNDTFTCSQWAVTCISTEISSSIHCYQQIWVPCDSRATRMFIRTAASGQTSYSDFTEVVTADYLSKHGVVNRNTKQTELFVQNTQPTAESGKTIVWIDTSH